MSFDLDVLAMNPQASDDDVRAMARRCNGTNHPDGELDERIVNFYETLRARYPDFPPYGNDSPWAGMPLGVGIDHVRLWLRYGERSDPAIDLILDLADRFGLVIYDPQGDEVTRPEGRAP